MTTLGFSRAEPATLQSAAVRGPRLLDLDRGKGLAIILVVIGHIAARDKPIGNDWYALLQFLIYSFHMPFFMYLAGFTFFYSDNATNPHPTYFRFVLRRARRLLIPFFAIGLLIVLGKIAARSFLHVDNFSGDAASSFRALLWDTGESPAESIWFVFVLFTYCAFVPPILSLCGQRLWPLLALAVLTYFLAAWLLVVPSYMYLDRIASYLIFFVLGGIANEQARFSTIIDRTFFVALFGFIVALGLLGSGLFAREAFVLCNFLGIPVMHGIARRASGGLLLWFGKYAFVVYLLNSIFIGLGKGLLLKFMSWDGVNFLIFAPLLGLLGLFGPITLKRLIFKKISALDNITN